MEIVLLGTGSALPDAKKSSPAFLLQYKSGNYLLDCGGGTSQQLMKVGVPPSALSSVLLTHIHIDHCVEFPSIVFSAYLGGKQGEFLVFGPPGTGHFAESVFSNTYDFAKPMMKRLRNIDIDINTKEIENGLVFEANGLSVTTLPVKHGIQTQAFRFEADGKSVVFSGDTEPCDSLIEIARGADILIIENAYPEETGPKPGHCIPSQVAQIAKSANVRKVILVHLFPICNGKEPSILAHVGRLFDGEVSIGYDLQKIVV